jgi:release factor glutamine methyltransferase
LTFDQLLRKGCLKRSLPRLEARLLLACASGRSPEWLVAHGADEADEASVARFTTLAQRRTDGEPIAYLTGVREFFGRPFAVTPAVLIPRPETELLVEIGLGSIAGIASPRVLDLGTGSGILAITLALECPAAQVVASDFSAPAVEVARANAAALGANGVSFRTGNWWQALGTDERGFDLIVSNPPYIAASDPHLSQGDLRFEPRHALSAGPEGDDDIRKLIAEAPAWLGEQGWLALEHGFEQGGHCRRLMQRRGFRDIATHADWEQRERVTIGRRGLA